MRGRGVGSALVAAAVDLCDRGTHILRIELHVYTDNPAAIALYSRHGFIIEGSCRQYAYGDGRYFDAHLMARLKPANPG